MIERLKKLLEERDKAYEAFKEDYNKVNKQFEMALLEEIPFMNKIVKIKGDVPKYIKVREIFKSKNNIIIRGYGFWSEFTPFHDATFANWDFMMEHELFFNSIEEDIKEVEEITEVEFNVAFNEMLDKMKTRHINVLL